MTATVTPINPDGFQFPVVVAYLTGDLQNFKPVQNSQVPVIEISGLIQDVMLDSLGNTYPLDMDGHEPSRH